MSELRISRAADLLANLTCGCGAAAQVCWYMPLKSKKEEPQKLSKTQVARVDVGPPKIQPYGWSCERHVPSSLHNRSGEVLPLTEEDVARRLAVLDQAVESL